MVRLDKLIVEKAISIIDSTALDLSQSNIDSIDENTFEKHSELLTVNLCSNQIDSLNEHALKGLTNLTYLNLSYNKLKIFDFIYLKHTLNLKILKLNNNQINSFCVKYSSDFKTLDLEELFLNNNQLASITRQNFNVRCLPCLKKLDLSSNKLDEFDAVLLKPARNLETFKIDLSWLKSFNYQQLPSKYLEHQFEIGKDFEKWIESVNGHIDYIFIGNFYKGLSTSLETKGMETGREIIYKCILKLKTEWLTVLNELIRLSIKNFNHKLLKELLNALIVIKADQDQQVHDKSNEGRNYALKLEKAKKEIQSEDFLLIAAQFGITFELLDVFKSFSLFQYDANSHRSNFKAILNTALDNNQPQLLASLFVKKEISTNDYWCDDDLILASCKHCECFQVIFYAQPNACFRTDKTVEHCLENNYMQTFEFILDEFNNLNQSEDELFYLILKNIQLKSSRYSSLFELVLDVNLSLSHSDLEKIFGKIYQLKSAELFDSLMFPADNKYSILTKLQSDNRFGSILKYLIETTNITNQMKQLEMKLSLNYILTNRNCFSAELVNKLKESDVFECEADVRVFELVCERNESSLMQYYCEHVKSTFDEKTLSKCVDLIVSQEVLESFLKYLYENKIDLEPYVYHFLSKTNKQHLVNVVLTVLKSLDLIKLFKSVLRQILNKKSRFIKQFIKIMPIEFKNNQNILHFAAKNCHHEAFIWLFEKDKSLLNKLDDKKQSAFDYAVCQLKNESEPQFPNDVLTRLLQETTTDACLNRVSLIFLCKRNDKKLLKKFLNKVKLFPQLLNHEMFPSSLDAVLQSKLKHSNQFAYDTHFIAEHIVNNANFDDSLISADSLLALYERNDLSLLQLIVSSKDFKLKDTNETVHLEKCIQIFISNENKHIASFFLNNHLNKLTQLPKIQQHLTNYCLRRIIECGKYDLANHLLTNMSPDSTELLDLLIKNVLLCEENFKYLKYLLENETFRLENLIQMNAKKTILHYTAEHCPTEIFIYFLERNSAQLNALNEWNETAFDILIKKKNKLNEFVHPKSVIFQLIDISNELYLNHSSFSTLCQRLDNVNDLIYVEKLVNDCKFCRSVRDSNENASLDTCIQKRNQNYNLFFFSEFFIKNQLLVKQPSLRQYKLTHKSFETLIERNDSQLLRDFIENETEFEHSKMTLASFNKCIETFVLNENRDMAQLVLNYLRQLFPHNWTDLIEYSVEYIELATISYKKPGAAIFFIEYLDQLAKGEILASLKDDLIKTILRVKEFHVLLKLVLKQLDIKSFISLPPKQNILHYAAQHCANETFVVLFNHFITESNYLNQTDNHSMTPLDIIIQRKNSQSQVFAFTSTFINSLIEDNLKNYDKLEINFSSFLALCERSDSASDRTLLIEYLIGKIKCNPTRIEESGVHFLIQKRQNENNKFFYSEFLLKRLIEKQPSDFRFLINDQSFTNLCNRGDLNLIRIVTDRADFSNQVKNSPLDILVQMRSKENMFAFSNPFIKQINENSKIFQYRLNHKSFVDLCERNDAKLMKIFIEKCEFRHGTQSFLPCIDWFVSNQKIAKCVFDYIAKRDPDGLIEYINSTIKTAITRNELKIAEFCMDYALCFKPDSFSSFLKNILTDETFVKYLLEEKRINNEFKKQIPQTQNILQYASVKYKSDTFLDLFNVSYEYLNQPDEEDQTPLDYLIAASEKFDNTFIKRVIYKLPIDFELKLSEVSFNKICIRMRDHRDWDTLRDIIERTRFDSFSLSPMNMLITLKNEAKVYWFNTSFIKTINLGANIYKNMTLIHEAFESLCERNDPDLFNLIVDYAKFDHQNSSFANCVDMLIECKDLNLKLAESFFKYLANFDRTGIRLFAMVNRCIKRAIDQNKFTLVEFVLEYFHGHIHKPENSYLEMNKNLVDHEILKKLKENKQWNLMKLILDCSDLSNHSEEKFCFSYFDYEDSNSNENSRSIRLALNQTTVELIELNDETPFLPRSKSNAIKKVEEHPLYWIVESGINPLKNHATTIKHLRLKWQCFPLTFYIMVTLLQLIYLTLFSYVVSKSFREERLENVKIHVGFKIVLYFFWSFFTSYEILQLCIEKLGYFCYEIKSNNYKKFNLKNFLELLTSMGSIVILVILFHHDRFKNVDLCFQILSYTAPLCIVLRYIVFILCLEKASWFGLYIVAFRRSFENSLYLIPLVVLLFTGFMISFGLKTINYNENFYNLTTLESIAEMKSMVLANIDNLDRLGMNTGDMFTNYILFFLFIFLMPVLLINLLIGVSTGQLEEVLKSAEIIQYEMRVVFTLTMQELLISKLGFRCCEKYFLFNEYRNRKVEFKKNNRKEAETEMMDSFGEIKNELKSHSDMLRCSLEQTRQEMIAKMSEQNDKFQTIQEGTLERINQNDKKMERQVKELEEHFLRQFDSLVLDLMNKTN